MAPSTPSPDPASPLAARRLHRLSWRKKLLFSGVTTVLLLLTLEGVLRWLVPPSPVRPDPWVGFSAYAPLFEVVNPEDHDPVVATAENKLVWFNAQSFPLRKAPGTKRVFSLGGSTTYGRPYRDITSYTGWLREVLPLVDAEHQWEVINAGGVSYASYRIAALMEELSKYEPDLFIVYTGQNEFLERRTYAAMFDRPGVQRLSHWLARTRTWDVMERLVKRKANASVQATQGDTTKGGATETDLARDLLPAEVDEMLNHTVGPVNYHRDPQWREQVLSHFRLNLARMTEIAHRCGAPILFVVPASNERDCSPFKSEFLSELAAPQRQEFEGLLARAESALRAEEPLQAASLLRQAEQLDGRHAKQHYLLGRALASTGDKEGAHREFLRAIEEDVCPLRAVADIPAAMLALEQQGARVGVLDFPARLRSMDTAQSGSVSFGNELFLDHVHPNIDVHRQLALWIVDDLLERGWCEGKRPAADQLASVDRRVRGSLSASEMGVAHRNLAKVLHWAGKFDEAAVNAEAALELLPDDAESLFVLAECYRHRDNPVEAYALLRRLFDVHPDYHRASLSYGALAAQAGDLQLAKTQLMTGLLYNPEVAYGHYWLGVTHLQLNEPRMAIEALTQADAIYPDDPATLSLLAAAHAAVDDHVTAIRHLERACRRAPKDAALCNQLGWEYLEAGRQEDAIRLFEQALLAQPDFEEARQNLKFVRETL